LVKKEEEEETLGQLRDRLGLTPGLARVATPGRRAVFVHIKVEDSSSGEDTDGEGEGGGGEEATGWEGAGEVEEDEGEVEEVEEVEEEEEEGKEEDAEPRDQRVQVPDASLTGSSEAVCPQSLPPPGSLRAPGRVADNTVQDNNDVQQPEEEAAGMVPELMVRGGCERASSSRFKGVCWNKKSNKWLAKFKGKHLGLHTTEEAAARA
jgi:hypothetical protein